MNDVAITADGLLAAPRRRRAPGLLEIWRTGNFPILSDIGIGWRFTTLVVLAIVAAAAFGAFAVLGERRIGAAMDRQAAYRLLGEQTNEVRTAALALRHHEREFLGGHVPPHADQFRDAMVQAKSRLDAIAAMPEAAGNLQLVESLRRRLAAIAGQFDQAAALAVRMGFGDSDGLRGRLRDSVAAIEGELKQWPGLDLLLSKMLAMRLAEKNFMLYGGESFLGVHRKAANEFDFGIDATSLPASVKQDFRTLLATYAADMADYAATSAELAHEVASLRTMLGDMQPDLGALLAFARQGVNDATTEQDRTRAETLRHSGLVGVLALLNFVLAGIVLARSVTRPIRRIEAAMEALAAGDHAVHVPGTDRKDEIGDMAHALTVFKDNAVRMVRLQAEQEEMKRQAEERHRAQMAALADQFEAAVKSVADAVSGGAEHIRETAETMASRVDSGASRSLAVAEAAADTERKAAGMADAVQQLVGSVAEIEVHAAATAEVARDAVAGLDRSTDRVAGLAAVAERIGTVVQLINGIAAQTNMLALNATIEAARAANAGRGFAVVAAEVKHLAQQTATATDDIARQIGAIQEATRETVDAIGDIGRTIRRLDEIAGTIAGAVERQDQVARRITDEVAVVAENSATVASGVIEVTQSAARYCGSAISVAWTASDLAEPAGILQREVDSFLARVRR